MAARTSDKYLSPAEAAEYLSVTTRTIRQMQADGRRKPYRLGGRVVRFKVSDIDAAMAEGAA
jgi:excisionase family DNA binding protein